MMTFFAIIGVVALIIFGKFVYDSYLTDNTERDWQEYKRINPHKALTLENNQGLNLRTSFGVRSDGYYICRYRGHSNNGNFLNINFILCFNSMNKVVTIEGENGRGFTAEEMQDFIRNNYSRSDNSHDCAGYEIKNGQISMKFVNQSGNGYEYVGSVLKDGFIVKRIAYAFDWSLMEKTTTVALSEMKFTFVKY